MRQGCISLDAWIELNSPSIIAFQETLVESDSVKQDSDYVEIFRGCKGFPYRSLAFFVHSSLTIVDHGIAGSSTSFAQWLKIQHESLGLITVIKRILTKWTIVQ